MAPLRPAANLLAQPFTMVDLAAAIDKVPRQVR
jgi:hypothetical protein